MGQNLVRRSDDPAASPPEDAVALIDYRPLRRAFVARFLEHSMHAEIVLGGGPEEILENAEAQRVSIVIVHVGGEALSVEGRARETVVAAIAAFPSVPLVVVSDLESRNEVLAAMSLGVQGFIPTSMSEEVVLATVQMVKAGGQYAPTRALLEGQQEGGNGVKPRSKSTGEAAEEGLSLDAAVDGEAGESSTIDGVTLSPRQCEVLSHLRHGLQNKEIAYRLRMSESTVKVHVRNIMKKLAVTNRTQAAFRAQRMTLPPPLHR